MRGSWANRIAEQALTEALRTPHAFAILEALLVNGELRDNPDIPTARISMRSTRGHLVEISPTFAARTLRTTGDALHILLHEILHKLHGDFLRDLPPAERRSPLLNLALDIYVDSHLMRLAFPEGPPYLSRLYPATDFPAALLLPPPLLAKAATVHDHAWKSFSVPYPDLTERLFAGASTRDALEAVATRWFRRLQTRHPEDVARIYLAGWLDELPFGTFFPELLRVLAQEPATNRAVLFLGNHDFLDDPDDLPVGLAALLNGTGTGGGPGHGLMEDRLHVRSRRTRAFHDAVLRALTEADTPGISPLEPDRNVVGMPSRAGLLSLAQGVAPSHYLSALPRPHEQQERVHLFLDVSWSLHRYHSLIYGLARALGPLIASPLALFSTEISPITLEDLSRGLRRTTGGTDFDCVVQHALDHRLQRILVVTDGDARLSPNLAEFARRRALEVFVVLSPDYGHHDPPRHGLTPITRQTWILPAGLS